MSQISNGEKIHGITKKPTIDHQFMILLYLTAGFQHRSYKAPLGSKIGSTQGKQLEKMTRIKEKE